MADKFAPSPYQQAVFDHVRTSRRNLIINAVAGSGKSTTIKKASKLCKGSYVVLAFNSAIAKEIKAEGYNAMTLNSIGYRALLRNPPRGQRVSDPDGDKTRTIAKQVITDRKDAKIYMSAAIKLVGLAKGIGLVPSDSRLDSLGLTPLTYDSQDVWYDLVDRYGVSLDADDADVDTAIGFAREILTWSVLQHHWIDFDDQKYFPVVFSLPLMTFNNVFLDESQDLNLLDRALVSKALAPGAKLVAVGDRNQAIYGWRGADIRSMDNIKDEFDCEELPLSVCYRCPTKVIEMAQEYVPHIEARAGAPEGVVETLTKFDEKVFKPGDLVICRNNAPLVRMAYRLIARRVPIRLLGRDLADGLVKLVTGFGETYDRVRPNEHPMPWLIVQVDAWAARETEKARARDKDALVDKIADMQETLHTFISSSDAESIPDLVKDIRALFDTERNRGGVTLSSIHKAKGGQAPRVFILDWHLCPSKYAHSEDAQQQELNLMYVALTRAQGELRFIETEGWE